MIIKITCSTVQRNTNLKTSTTGHLACHPLCTCYIENNLAFRNLYTEESSKLPGAERRSQPFFELIPPLTRRLTFLSKRYPLDILLPFGAEDSLPQTKTLWLAELKSTWCSIRWI